MKMKNVIYLQLFLQLVIQPTIKAQSLSCEENIYCPSYSPPPGIPDNLARSVFIIKSVGGRLHSCNA